MSGSGIFIHGESRMEAIVRAAATGLEIRDPRDNLMVALWAYADLTADKWVATGAAPKKLRLCCATDPGARLTVEDPQVIAALLRANRTLHLPRRRPSRRRRVVRAAAGLLIVLAVLGTLLLGALPLADAVPATWDLSLGRLLDRLVTEQLGGTCREPAGQAALAEIARRLNDSGALPLPLVLQVVDSPAIQGLALPDGTVVLTSGLLNEVENGDQIAAVAALEAAHGALHQVTRSVIRQAGPTLAIAFATGMPARLAHAAVERLLAVTYDRQRAEEAYGFAEDLLERANLPVQSLGNFFRLEMARQHQRNSPSPLLIAHPLTGNHKDMRGIQAFARPALTDREWSSLRAVCRS